MGLLENKPIFFIFAFMIIGGEYHSIIGGIFNNDVKGINYSEQLQVNCPRCQEREYLNVPDGKYNLEINTNKRVFRCWKCEEPRFTGSLGRLIKLYGTQADYELYKAYSGRIMDDYDSNTEEEYENIFLPEEFISFSQLDPTKQEHMEAYRYLKYDRQIDFETIKRYNIGFCLTGKYEGRIIIPSYDKFGDLNYFVSRAYKKGIYPKYINPKIKKGGIIFNEGLINWDSTIYMVEGAFDGLSVKNPLVLLGKDIPENLFHILKEKKPPIVILLDPDAYEKAIEIFNMLSSIYVNEEHKLRIVKMEGDYDIDEMRIKMGKDAVIKKLYTARKLEVSDYFIKNKYTEELYGKKNSYRYRNY